MTAGLHPELPTIRRERSRQAWFPLLRCERASVGRAAPIDVKSLDKHAGVRGTYKTQTLTRPLQVHVHAGPSLASCGKYPDRAELNGLLGGGGREDLLTGRGVACGAVGILATGEKAAIDDRTGDGASVGEGRSVGVGVCLRVSSDQDIGNAMR